MSTAAYKRRLQFCAGPQWSYFYACEEHKSHLDNGEYNGLFFAYPQDVMESIEPNEDEYACDYCREG